MTHTSSTRPGIAVIGMAAYFPGAASLSEFWRNMRDGTECISLMTREQALRMGAAHADAEDADYVPAWGVLPDVDQFDAAFFGYAPRDARLLDPQQRLLLRCAWEALENAGYTTERYDGRIGVFAGAAISTYLLRHLLLNPDVRRSAGYDELLLANDKDTLATRISYHLDLQGPSVTVQCACSTSLVAAHLACQSLLGRECDIALAGGVSIQLPQCGYRWQDGGILSRDGHCRVFDARATGTVGGSGVGLVVLKPLADAIRDGDKIHAVVTGSAVNNDGSAKVGYTAPRVEGQAQVIRLAHEVAQVTAGDIGYVETHGTGTVIGDPLEVRALTRAFRATTDRRRFCALGAAKATIGHLDAAAGVAGLIKTVLALEHATLPASPHVEVPNPALGLDDSPFFIPSRARDWPAGGRPRRAGVSSFGIGGTNAHVVLEEAPTVEPAEETAPDWHLLPLSARTATGLRLARGRLAAHLSDAPDQRLSDVAYTLQVGRRTFRHRLALVCSDGDHARRLLEAGGPTLWVGDWDGGARPVAFLFPGQGSQYPGMARELYESESVFRNAIDSAAALLRRDLDADLRDLLFASELDEPERRARLDETAVAQPAIFAVEYALAQLWSSCGIRPRAMLGHSVGEYVAACLAGTFTFEACLTLLAARGRLIQGLPGGAMLAVRLPAGELQPLLASTLSLAAVNGPDACVASGPHSAVEALRRVLEERSVPCTPLRVSHAFHSRMMAPIVGAFAAEVARASPAPPSLRFVSSTTGDWVTDAQATDPSYWADQLVRPVRFHEGVRTLLSLDRAILLEVGPGRALTTMVRGGGAGRNRLALATLGSLEESRSSRASFLAAAARLWVAGAPADPAGAGAGRARRRVPLPTYPFEPGHHWVEAPGTASALVPDVRPAAASESRPAAAPGPVSRDRPGIATEFVPPEGELQRRIRDVWARMLGFADVGIHDNFFELGGHSLLGVRLVAEVNRATGCSLPASALLAAPTIAELSEVVRQQVEGPLQDDEVMAALLAELRDTPQEDLRRELRALDESPAFPHSDAGEPSA